MSSVPVLVGLDYHQDGVQVCVLDPKGIHLCNRSVQNDAEAIHRAATRYGTPRRIAIETCCGAADLAAELTTDRGLPIQLAHPGYVNRMKRAPDKSDLGDAQLLADLVRVNYLPRVWLAPKALRELRRPVRQPLGALAVSRITTRRENHRRLDLDLSLAKGGRSKPKE